MRPTVIGHWFLFQKKRTQHKTNPKITKKIHTGLVHIINSKVTSKNKVFFSHSSPLLGKVYFFQNHLIQIHLIQSNDLAIFVRLCVGFSSFLLFIAYSLIFCLGQMIVDAAYIYYIDTFLDPLIDAGKHKK